jgi:2-octaprenyl-6-methoxyphenol hydroxylase
MTYQDHLIQTQVIIIGTGMVGSLLAIALSPFVDSIVILDKVEPDIHRNMSMDSRPLSLNVASVQALQQVNVWNALQSFATSIQHVHVSQCGYLGTTQFYANDYDIDQLGAVIPADALALTLLKAALQLPGVRFQKIDDLKAIHQKNEKIILEYTVLDKPVLCESNYLFGCDGSHSKVAKIMGFQSIQEGETLYALTCDLLQVNLKGTAYERFTDKGTLALLPKLNGHAGLVFTGTQDEIESLELLDDDAFIRTIHGFMADRLPSTMTASKRHKKTLENLKHEPISQGQVLLLGNAARTLYPIAAQGFNLGLRDVMQLQAVFECANQVNDHHPSDIIQTFLALREEDQKATSQFTSRIAKLFSKKHTCFSHLRGLGLMGLDLTTPLKTKLAQRALGLSGSVKRVLKLIKHDGT